MELKDAIVFDELLDAVMHLPQNQQEIIRSELNKKAGKVKNNAEKKPLTDFQKFLLNFPVMSDEQYKEYKQIRKELNQWRTK